MARKFFKALVIISILLCLVIFFGHFISEEWPNPAKIEQEKMIVEAMVNFLIFSQWQHRLTIVFCIFFGGLECVGHSFAYVAHIVFFGRCLDSNPHRAVVASRYASNLATLLPIT